MEKVLITQESLPFDISREFSEMDIFGFKDFLRKNRDKQSLSIIVDLSGYDREAYVIVARRLKAFIEDFSTRPQGGKQDRHAIIKGTVEQRSFEPNVLSSGVSFEELR